MDALAIGAAFMAFAATTLAVFVVVSLLPSEEQRVLGRLRPGQGGLTAVASAPSSLLKRRQEEGSIGLLRVLSAKWRERFTLELERADLGLRVEEYITICLAVGVVLAVIGYYWVWQSGFIAIGGLLAGSYMPRFYVQQRARARSNAISKQLVDAVTLLSTALKSGYSFLQAVEAAAREMQPPISKEFRRVLREMNLGADSEDCLLAMGRRLSNYDLDLVVSAVLIQRKAGGNLAEVLDRVAGTMRERIRIRGEIKTLTAQGRYSGWIIGLLPVVLLLVLSAINREYMSQLFDTRTGVLMLVAAAAAEVVGFFMISRLVKVDY